MSSDLKPSLNPNISRLREGAVFSGFIFGLLVGGLVTLLRGPRLNIPRSREDLDEMGQEIRERLESVTPGDPLDEGIAEGKAAARRRLAELGQRPNDNP